jgi:hypothetical protein
MLDKRGTSFGFGKKFDFTTEKKTLPDPTKYSSCASIDVIRPRSMAFTFGISRESCSKRYVPGHFIADPSVPGPGSYQLQSKIGKEGAKYTISGKSPSGKLYSDSAFTPQSVPGPGTYITTSSSPGKYFISTFKSSPIPVIAPKSHKRFKSQQDPNFPGPGSYNFEEKFLKTGCILSKYKYEGARKFSQSSREIFEKQKFEIPGPGSYKLPSEFGYVEVKKRTLSVNS